MFLTKSPSHPAFDPILVRDAVLLRAGKPSDHAQWAALREESRMHLVEWEEDWPPHHATLSAFKRRLGVHAKDARRGGGLSLFVFRRDDRALIGGVTLSNIRYGAARSGLLGYWIGAPHAGKGYGKAAVMAMIDHAFDVINLHRIVAACQPDNAASQNLLRRCGFRREGLARDYLKINGEWRDHQIFALTTIEHQAAAQNA